jgi:uncharacterized protein
VSAARFFGALAGGAARRPRVALALALGVGGAVLALQLKPTAATSTFVSSHSSSYQATQRFYRNFGEEPIDVLVHGDLQKLVLSNDIVRLLGLEGCLSGNVPAKALPSEGGADGPCGRLASAKTVKVVLGPGTFVNESARQINEQLAVQTRQAEAEARQAQRVVRRAALARGESPSAAATLGRQASEATLARFHESVAELALLYGLSSAPSIGNPNFVSTLVFDSTKPAGTPKQRFAYLFPSRDAALVSVRMKAGLSQTQRSSTISLIRQAVAMPQWHLQHGESYMVTGVPVVVSDLAAKISHAIALLLVAVVLVMAAVLLLVFSGRPRLLPLALALLACALTFGALSLAGESLTVASIAVLPVLVGLAVDYSIQFQVRVQEQLAPPAPDGAAAGPPPGPTYASALERAARAGAPTIATAAAASAAAMLVLLLSPVPMVRGFGVLLVVGVAIALACAFSAGAAALAQAAAPRSRFGAGAAARSGIGALTRSPLGAAWRGARELVRENVLTRALTALALGSAVRHPRRLLAAGLALAALGWGLDTQTHVETDLTKLVPQSMASLQALHALEQTSGIGGEIDLLMSGSKLTSPATIEWMSSFQSAVLRRYGYTASAGCARARLCPAFSLPDLFATQAAAGAAGTKPATKLTQAQVNALLGVIPPYFSQEVIGPGHRTATLAFGIRLMGLDQQQKLIEGMRSSLHPPKGVSAALVGLPVLAASSGAQVASAWWRVQTLLAGLAAVALVLMLAFRGDRRRVLVPLAPIVLASGWSALILFALRVPLNPMSVTLGALVIAISTEFSVLLSERQRAERLRGAGTIEALRISYRRTGAAVAASGVTAIAGFGVLMLSDIRMLRDFGLVTLVDLSVALLGVLIALPAAVVIADAAAEEGGSGARERLRAPLAPTAPGHEVA